MSRFRIHNLNLSFNFSNEDSFKCQIKQLAIKCQKDIDHFSFNMEEFRSYIATYLIPYSYYDPLYWYSNPLTQEIKKHIGNEIPMCFFNALTIEEDPTFQNSFNQIKNIIESTILSNEDISSKEAIELLDISLQLPNLYPDLICNYLISKILEQKIFLDNYNYQRLFFHFANLFKKRNNLKCYFIQGHLTPQIVGDKKIITDAIIKNINGTYRIIFNEETLTCFNILENLRTLFHETRHYVQKNALYSEQYYRELFIMDTFLSKTKGEYNDNNYDLLSDENDAFLYENILLYHYLQNISLKVFEKEKRKILRTIREKQIARNNLARQDQFGNPIYIDEYFEKIAKIYNINPYDLGLIYTYHPNGKRLTPLELFKKLENLDTTDELYNYYIALLFNSNYAKEDLPKILKELKKEIDYTTGDYLLLIKIYWIYVKQFLNNIRNNSRITTQTTLKEHSIPSISHIPLIKKLSEI